MTILYNVLTAPNLTQALTMGRPAAFTRSRPVGSSEPWEFGGTATRVDLDSPPTFEELKNVLAEYDRCRVTLGINANTKRVEVYFGTKSEPAAIISPRFAILSNPSKLPLLDPVCFNIAPMMYESSVVSPAGITRIRNLTERYGRMDFRDPESNAPYSFEVETYLRGLPSPLRQRFETTPKRAYAKTGALYHEIIETLRSGDPGVKSRSLAITGLPRALTRQATAEFYYLTWEDFADLFRYFDGDFFAVFNPEQSWVPFFKQ